MSEPALEPERARPDPALEHEAEQRRHAEAERRIRDSDRRFRAIFESAPLPCLITDAAGTARPTGVA